MRKTKKISKKIKEPKSRKKNSTQKAKMPRVQKERPMVVRVTKTEFELDDGRIFPMVFDFADDEVPTPQEFQEQYDKWLALFTEMELTGNEQKTD